MMSPLFRSPSAHWISASLAALMLLGASLSAQAPGEVLRAVHIPGSSPADPVLHSGEGFGRSVANVGDVDGDGTVDLLVGAANNRDGALPGEVVASAGAAYLLFLTPEGTVRAHVRYSNRTGSLPFLEEEDFFGKCVSGLGDLDGDGVLDVAVGAPGDDDGAVDHGAVYVLFLHADGTIKRHQKISATEGGFVTLDAGSEWSRGIAPLGDLDGDGVLDLAVSRMARSRSAPFEGTVYVLFLRPDGTIRDFRAFTLTDLGLYYGQGLFGFYLSSADLDGDGLLDLVGGDIGYDGRDGEGANPRSGAVWFLTLNADGTPKAGWLIAQDIAGFTEPLDPFDHFGSAADYPRIDFDRDGVLDLVVGRKRDDDNYAGSCDSGDAFCPDYATCCYDSGAAYVLFLNPDWTVKGWQKISNLHGRFPGSHNQDDRFGQCLDSLGDLDGDGFPEVAISSRWDDDTVPNGGIVYVCTINDGSVAPSVAWFGASPLAGNAPLSVSFADASVGVDLDTWSWDFGDGGTSALQNPTHVFASPGTYTVRLEVDGLSGYDRVTRTNLIVVAGSGALTAAFDAAPRSGSAPLDVAFTDLSTGSPASWEWSFGDGGTSALQDPAHTYGADGTYTVSLTVTAAGGETDTHVETDFIQVGSDALRLGCDPLAAGTLTIASGAPAIGTTLVLGIDNPYGTQAAGSTTVLRAAFTPAAEYPCGFWVASYGMAFAGAPGEILLALVPAPLTFPGTAFGGADNPGLVTVPIPNNLALVGRHVFCQGVIFDPVAAAGVQFGVTDGLELVLR
ncbi:MAG: PKD domain-containing protein [Planctomycetota bacterium]